MKKIIVLFLVLTAFTIPLSALAYPKVGTSTKYYLPITRDSGSFQNFHFPSKYFRGGNNGFEIELNSATVGGTDIAVTTYKYSVSDGVSGTWYTHGTGTTNTDELGICSFKSSSNYYYCYKFTKTTSGTININYSVRNLE